MVTRFLIAIIALSTLAVGCEQRSTRYCGLHPDDLANCEQTDAPTAPPVMCTMDNQCSPPHCEIKTNVCVECTDKSHCPAGELCDVGGTFSCRGCLFDLDCGGAACLPNGSCGDDDSVLYVTESGDDAGNCTVAAPCATVAEAVNQASDSRKYIRITGEVTDSPTISKDVEILGTGATLSGAIGPDWVIKTMTSVVKIYGLKIFCAGGADQTGVKTDAGSTTTLDRVDVSGCGRPDGAGIQIDGFVIVKGSRIHDNPTVGIKTSDKANFTITNNFIYRNGTSSQAGVTLGAGAVRPETKFEFNTLVDNTPGTAAPAGMTCVSATPIPNNLFVNNGGLIAGQVATCVTTGALLTDAASAAFVDAAADDFHITETSNAKDLAPDGSPAIDDDIDSNFRPIGPAKDYGADEYLGQ